jgi:hypothetical protein
MGYPAATRRGLRAPTRRAPETLHRRPSGAAIPAPTAFWRRVSLNRAGSLVFSARRAWRSGGKGGSRRLRNTGRCALTASRKNGSPAPAAFSLAPQLRLQSNAGRRCANPRTGKSQLSAPNSLIQGMGSYPSLQQGRINPSCSLLYIVW